MVQSLWDCVARSPGKEESTTTWHRTSACDTPRTRSSASSPRATNSSGPARNGLVRRYEGQRRQAAQGTRSRERPAQGDFVGELLTRTERRACEVVGMNRSTIALRVLRQRPRVRRARRSGLVPIQQCRFAFQRSGPTVAKRLDRIVQRPPTRRVAQRVALRACWRPV